MDSQRNPPSGFRARLIGWRARRVADPVARLRYLKRATERGPSGTSLKRKGLLAIVALAIMIAVPYQASWSVSGSTEPRVFLRPEAPAFEEQPPVVWLVEHRQHVEVYSNGLRVETRHTVANEPRSYKIYDRRGQVAEVRQDGKPAGIVSHTTESQIAPFEQDQNRKLQRIGESLIEYVRQNRSYHFVIDRFGRAWRVVAESDAANHAGYSVWADGGQLYVNLNRSFLGISFEARTGNDSEDEVTAAQIHTARVLTEMLRAKYAIPMRNCVTHAQVSVNPANMRIGYHTDWADRFPFAQLGLPDNYLRPVPALWACGFTYDPVFVKSTGERLWQGLARAEELLRQEAAANGAPVARHRQALQRRYKAILETLKDKDVATEERDDHEKQREQPAGHRP